MRRTRALCLVGSLSLAASAAATAEPSFNFGEFLGSYLGGPVPVEAEVKAPAPAQVHEIQIAAADVPLPERKPPPGKMKKPEPLAKELFGRAKLAADLSPRALGSYAKGCLAGGVHLSDAGPDWQTMRPSRNRAWGHPKLIKLLQRLGSESRQDGWTGLLVGDISQPRGGPMLSGHMSHQMGLDADVWLTPMPDRVLTKREREDISATSMLDKTKLAVDPKQFTPAHAAIIKRAASYPSVERIFVHPAIKKSLCTTAGKDRAWLGKVRPIWGHHYHFHIRMGCTNAGCEKQAPVHGDDGCGKEIDNWLKTIEASLKPKPKPPGPEKPYVPPSERRRMTMEQLPSECRIVLNSPSIKPIVGEAAAPATTGSSR
jgi:penicillin-insensitive murein endopeptidase